MSTSVPERSQDAPGRSGAPASMFRRAWRREPRQPAASFVDGLIGLGSERALQEELQRQVAIARRSGQACSLLVLDVDGFGGINEAFGHDTGDRILAALADAMRDVAAPGDKLFRLGADELAMVMPGVETDRAAYVGQRLSHLCARPLDGGRPFSFSAGITSVPRFGADADQALRQADAALHWAKWQGPGAVEVFDPERDQTTDEGDRNVVREIIAGRALAAVYQPIVDMRYGRVLGFEGLVRPDPRGPLPGTARLFAAAAATGTTIELNVACVEAVIAGAHGIGPEQVLTLNLSPSTLEVEDFDAAWLLDRLVRVGITTSRVILEMTERDEVRNPRRLRAAFDHLHQYGVRVAADDVGADNAGFRLLSHVRFDIVKIDLSRVHLSEQHEGSLAVLRSLRDLVASQNSAVVAEGVETAAQLRTIRGLSIYAAQGYLLGRPAASTAVSFVELGRLMSSTGAPPSLPTPPAPQVRRSRWRRFSTRPRSTA